MLYSVSTTRRFDKSVERMKRRGVNMDELRTAITLLANTGSLSAKYHPHMLSGNYANKWECHIKPDWLLIWEQNDTELKLLLLETGTHSDLF